MPTYGDRKVRTMVRSVLPSTYRKGARADRRLAHKQERARTRDAINSGAEYIEDLTADAERARDHRIDEIKWDRRQGDKLGPVMRWGPTTVVGTRRLDKLSKLKAVFPKDLVGRHAISHLRYHDDIEVPWGYYGRWQTRAEERSARTQVVKSAKQVMEERVTEMYLMGEHGHFNKVLKTRWPDLAPMPTVTVYGRVIAQPWRQARQKDFRPLYGGHDVEAFVDYIHLSSAWPVVDQLLSE